MHTYYILYIILITLTCELHSKLRQRFYSEISTEIHKYTTRDTFQCR